MAATVGLVQATITGRNKIVYPNTIFPNNINNDESASSDDDSDISDDNNSIDGSKMKKNFYKKRYQKTIVRFNDLDDSIIKITTGFPSILTMMAFIIILVDGRLEEIAYTTTTLSWLEEWLIYFEIIYGRQNHRWIDVALKYKTVDPIIRKIFVSKLEIHKRISKSWPPFATFDEDKALRKEKWNQIYDNKRVIFWDTTNVPLTYKPSAADAQRNTYNVYYAGNVAKGGVSVQLCGWIATSELFVGAINDTDYILKSGILTTQETYIEKYDPDRPTTWTIICDRGFLIALSAFKAGRQIVIQPTFSIKHTKFTDYETIRTAAVAKDRSGNERGVRVMKLSDFISQGMLPNENTHKLSDVWRCWGFQSNFMYRPIH
jgi:hypothetical protein